MTTRLKSERSKGTSLRLHHADRPLVPQPRRRGTAGGEELTTSAIRHANTPFTEALERFDQSVLLTGTDGSPDPPVQLRTDLLDTGRRGLSIVDLVSGDWGVIRPEMRASRCGPLRAASRHAQRGSAHLRREEDFEVHLDAAVVTRPTIEQAKGVLVTLRSATPDQAFAELRHTSQPHNVKLRQLAAALVETPSCRGLDNPELRKVIWQEWDRFPTRL